MADAKLADHARAVFDEVDTIIEKQLSPAERERTKKILLPLRFWFVRLSEILDPS